MKQSNGKWPSLLIAGAIALALGLAAAVGATARSGADDATAVAGEDAQMEETVTLRVRNLACSGCEARIEKVLRKMDGVQPIEASAEDKEAVVGYDPAVTGPDEIVDRLNESNFGASQAPDDG